MSEAAASVCCRRAHVHAGRRRPASRPLYQLGSGGIVILASSASIATTASTSFRSQASTKRSTISRSSSSPRRRSVACWVWLGQPLVDRLVRSLQRAVDGDRGRLEHLGGLPGREAEHVAEDQHGALPRGQVLERGDEGELDCSRAARSARPGRPRPRVRARVRVGLEPDRLAQRLAEAVVWVGRGRVVDREHALGPPLDRAQAGVGRDPIEPGAKRASTLEAWQPAPGAEQRLLQRVLGVGVGAEHPVAVGVKLAAVGLDEARERLLVACAVPLRAASLRSSGVIASAPRSAISPASGAARRRCASPTALRAARAARRSELAGALG